MKSKKNNFNYSQFINYLKVNKNISDPIICKFFFRPLSIRISWVFYKAGIRANTISLISVILAFLASFLIIISSPENIILPVLIMMIISLLDCIDGNVARSRGENSPSGEWMDALSGYTVYALLPFSLGIFLSANFPNNFFPGTWIIIGALTSISNLYLRLIFQKYLNSKIENINNEKITSKKSIFTIFSSEVGLVGWMMPSLFITVMLNALTFYLLFYCFFYVVSAFIISIYLIVKLLKN